MQHQDCGWEDNVSICRNIWEIVYDRLLLPMLWEFLRKTVKFCLEHSVLL